MENNSQSENNGKFLKFEENIFLGNIINIENEDLLKEKKIDEVLIIGNDLEEYQEVKIIFIFLNFLRNFLMQEFSNLI